jgi:hypothetical protein
MSNEPRRTKDELIEFATSMGYPLRIRMAAAESLYQRGRADAANELSAVLTRAPADQAGQVKP